MESSPVCDFYENAHILVTGGTGFMGKVLVEKLLKTCPGIAKVYLVIRVKKGKDPSDRMKELFDDIIFSKLKEEAPDSISKVVLIAGDCCLPGLGISEKETLMLTKVLTHVFHGAATVRFDEQLRLAIGINVQGVKEMMLFCQKCTELKSIIHTSTAYANCPRDSVDEKFYEPAMSADNAIQLMNCLSDAQIDPITEQLINPWPNTYSYTKAIAEDAIQKYGQGLPLAVFRPSIVVGTAYGPLKGWIDNLYGPNGVTFGVGAGVLRVLMASPECQADLVPCDMAVNAIICAAWEVGTKHKTSNNNNDEKGVPSNEIPVYQFVTDKENTLTWGNFGQYAMKHGLETPSSKALWFYTITLTKYQFVYKFLAVFFHLIPALIMDAGTYLAGKKPQLWAIYIKIHKFNGVISAFSTRDWEFGNNNTKRLWKTLTETDRNLFDFDMRSLNWDQYFRDNIDGLRLYMFKEPFSNLMYAKRRMFCLRIAHHILQLVVYSLLGYALYTIFSFCLSSQPDWLTSFTSSRWASRKNI